MAASSLAFIRHFDGRSWSTLSVPEPGDGGKLTDSPYDTLLAASAAHRDPGAAAVFLVGDQGDPFVADDPAGATAAPLAMIMGG